MNSIITPTVPTATPLAVRAKPLPYQAPTYDYEVAPGVVYSSSR